MVENPGLSGSLLIERLNMCMHRLLGNIFQVFISWNILLCLYSVYILGDLNFAKVIAYTQIKLEKKCQRTICVPPAMNISKDWGGSALLSDWKLYPVISNLRQAKELHVNCTQTSGEIKAALITPLFLYFTWPKL